VSALTRVEVVNMSPETNNDKFCKHTYQNKLTQEQIKKVILLN